MKGSKRAGKEEKERGLEDGKGRGREEFGTEREERKKGELGRLKKEGKRKDKRGVVKGVTRINHVLAWSASTVRPNRSGKVVAA